MKGVQRLARAGIQRPIGIHGVNKESTVEKFLELTMMLQMQTQDLTVLPVNLTIITDYATLYFDGCYSHGNVHFAKASGSPGDLR